MTPTDPKVEYVARVMYEQWFYKIGIPWDIAPPDFKEIWIDASQAALKAAKEWDEKNANT